MGVQRDSSLYKRLLSRTLWWVWRKAQIIFNLIFAHLNHLSFNNAQRMKVSIKDFFSKCDQIRSYLGIWPHLLKKCLMKNFIFCVEIVPKYPFR